MWAASVCKANLAETQRVVEMYRLVVDYGQRSRLPVGR